MRWQPIETVPVHKSVILCFRWREVSPGYGGKPFVAEGYLDRDKKWRMQDGSHPSDDLDPPTEWMPLPDAP